VHGRAGSSSVRIHRVRPRRCSKKTTSGRQQCEHNCHSAACDAEIIGRAPTRNKPPTRASGAFAFRPRSASGSPQLLQHLPR
jgi:hypothetical protein